MRSKGPEGGGSDERAGLKRCRTLTNLNATCFKLCQNERETPTLETSRVIAFKPKRRAGAGDTREPSHFWMDSRFTLIPGNRDSYPRGLTFSTQIQCRWTSVNVADTAGI